ncbi:MAG: acetyl-CoA C-acyltransferase [Acidobacteria bacterium]|nr:acetyl-CoA C-acyltransferase [Acidobacteriota bacterium]
MNGTSRNRRVAIVSGCRTPFCRANTEFNDVSAVDLARHATVELLARSEMVGSDVDLVVMGQVVQSPLAPNLAREVSLLPQFPRTVPAFSVNEACASAAQAITDAADRIALGYADVAIAGGAESLSNVPILLGKRLSDTLVALGRARSIGDRLRLIARLRPWDLAPVAPAIAEPSTGLTMGQSAEKMAKENRIARSDQDAWALRSHQLAHAAAQDGRLAAEIAPFVSAGVAIDTDNGVRPDTSLEQMAGLRPAFDRKYGSVTAANASPLTDGASVVLLMAEDVARESGRAPLAYIRSHALAAVDPGEQLLMGPRFAVPLALQRAGISWNDLGLIEMHEAFAAQVLSNLEAFRQQPDWNVNTDIINVMGGSIAIGHPFGATGGRLVTTLANEMHRRGVRFGLVSICAQGGLGSAVVLEGAQ